MLKYCVNLKSKFSFSLEYFESFEYVFIISWMTRACVKLIFVLFILRELWFERWFWSKFSDWKVNFSDFFARSMSQIAIVWFWSKDFLDSENHAMSLLIANLISSLNRSAKSSIDDAWVVDFSIFEYSDDCFQKSSSKSSWYCCWAVLFEFSVLSKFADVSNSSEMILSDIFRSEKMNCARFYFRSKLIAIRFSIISKMNLSFLLHFIISFSFQNVWERFCVRLNNALNKKILTSLFLFIFHVVWDSFEHVWAWMLLHDAILLSWFS
jgi:hypothetical protein